MKIGRKRVALASVVVAVVMLAFFVGGYAATGNWLPWGNRHYYEVLNVNFGYCVSGSQNYCGEVHNTMYNTGMKWVEQAMLSGASNPGCNPAAACSMHFISLSASSVTLAAGDSSTGASNGDCGNAGAEGGAEITTNGLARAAGAVTDISGASPESATIVKLFTATGTQAVQVACLVNQSTQGNANNVQLAAATFNTVNMLNGDTLQITWTISYTWS